MPPLALEPERAWPWSISLAHLSAGGTPREFIAAASQAGFSTIGLRICARRPGEPYTSPLLRNDAALRELKTIVDDAGIGVTTINAYQFYPEVDWDVLAPVVDAAAVIGAARIMVNGFDPELSRFVDRVGAYGESAGRHGMHIALEFMPYSCVRSLDAALAVLDQVGAGNAGVVVDALHLERSGGTPADVARVPAGRIALAQLCDARASTEALPDDVLMQEARTARLALGTGELPLTAFLQALPENVEVEYEVARADLADLSPLQRVLAARADIDGFAARYRSELRR